MVAVSVDLELPRNGHVMIFQLQPADTYSTRPCLSAATFRTKQGGFSALAIRHASHARLAHPALAH